MSEPPDLASLAQRYLALWQDYLTEAAADPELADTLSRMLAGMGAAAGAWARPPWFAEARDGFAEESGAEESGRTGDEEAFRAGWRQDGAAPASRAAGAAPAAATPDERDDGLDELKRRLALLEDRLAALEAGKEHGERKRGKRARSPARRDRS